MSYIRMTDPQFGFFDASDADTRGTELTEVYNAAAPFPHIVIDDFLPNEVLETCLREFPQTVADSAASFNRPQEKLKSQFSPDKLGGMQRSLFYSFNSRPFIRILENITGIKGLIPDPYFMGAGFHEIRNGGHLSIHADFNHHKPMDLERRINVLIYMNKDWTEDYGGQLELWDNDMKRCEKSVVPLFNRCVIFNTTSTSNHGNPRTVNHPQNVSRKSIALYYYTSTWSDEKRDHTTQFRTRPGTTDRADISVKSDELARDLLPPVVYRAFKKIARRLSLSR